ncbi:MAG: rhodanese-like domain-containing protein [Dehalococcoidia bacterium]
MEPPKNQAVSLIGREELKEKLDRGEDFSLVMVYQDWAFRRKHIPGSINIPIPFAAGSHWGILAPHDEIVVYCSAEECAASRVALQILRREGYQNVRRYSGGIADWDSAGYPLEGTASTITGT